jgi:hypothetical protein
LIRWHDDESINYGVKMRKQVARSESERHRDTRVTSRTLELFARICRLFFRVPSPLHSEPGLPCPKGPKLGQATNWLTKPRRTTNEVQAERAAKAQAKADSEEAKKQPIIRAAEFEHADRANEDFPDATPTSNPRIRSRKRGCRTRNTPTQAPSQYSDSGYAPPASESYSDVANEDPPPASGQHIFVTCRADL